MPSLNQRGIVSQILIVVILLFGLGIAFYLVKNPTVFKSKANQSVILDALEITDIQGNKIKCDGGSNPSICNINSPKVVFKIKNIDALVTNEIEKIITEPTKQPEGSLTVRLNSINDGNLDIVSLTASVQNAGGGKVFYNHADCPDPSSCAGIEGWFAIPNGDIDDNSSKTINWKPDPNQIPDGKHTFALWDRSGSKILSLVHVNYQLEAIDQGSEVVVSSTPSSNVTATSVVIDINGQKITLGKDYDQKVNLAISDLAKESDTPIKIDVTYSDGSTKSFYITFHYKPLEVKTILATENQTKDVKVLVLKYFPLDDSKLRLSFSLTNLNTELPIIRSKVNDLTQQGLQKLTESSKYHGYKTNSQPALNYVLTDTKEFLVPIPLSGITIPWSGPLPDYQKVLNENNVCDYVDNKGVNQVWIWGYHTKLSGLSESNMSMGTNSKEFWNFDDFGDLSNSTRLNDLPICNKTYVVFHYNYERGLGELLENHGHQVEAVLRYLDEDLFWNKFVNPHGDINKNIINHCGWIHSPPNSTNNLSGTGVITSGGQYDWVNEKSVLSDCEDWDPDSKDPKVKQVSCHTWYGTTCLRAHGNPNYAQDFGAAYKVWWFQNLPGVNNGLTYQGKQLRNWWVFIGDFDAAIAIGKTFVAPSRGGVINFKIQSVTNPQDSLNQQEDYISPASLPHPY